MQEVLAFREIPPAEIGMPARVERILALHWRACLDGTVPPGLPPGTGVDAAMIRAAMADPRTRYMFGQDRHSRFWHRELAYLALLSSIALHASWANPAPRPVSTALLMRHAGLSDRMVRLTLAQGIATGDLIETSRAVGRHGRLIELSPPLAAAIERRNTDTLGYMAGRLERRIPVLPAAARHAFNRLRCLMVLTVAGPLGTPTRRPIHRRSFLFLMFELLAGGPQPLAPMVAAAADRLHVTPMTVRNTLALARATGWLAPGPQVAASAMAEERIGLACATVLHRWALVLDLLEALEAAPERAAEFDAAVTAAAE